MYDANTTRSEPSLIDSVVRTFEAGQRVILDRLDLAYFDLRQLVTRTLAGGALIAVGAVLVVGAWFTVMGGVVVWLHQYLSLPVSLGLVAVTSAAVGTGAIAAGVRRAHSGAAAGITDLVESVREGAPDELVESVRERAPDAAVPNGVHRQ